MWQMVAGGPRASQLQDGDVHVHNSFPGLSLEELSPLLLLPSIFPSIRVFSIESVLQSGGQSIGASASTSVLSMNIQG